MKPTDVNEPEESLFETLGELIESALLSARSMVDTGDIGGALRAVARAREIVETETMCCGGISTGA